MTAKKAAKPSVGAPAPPVPTAVPASDPKKANLLENVQDAVRALPVHFSSSTHIEGLEAGDLFSLNSVLGGTIEVQVVETLNKLRQVWDPDDEWLEYGFERLSQSFPDVRLLSRTGGAIDVVVGIELKGWYLLAKEGVPSFRYTVSPSVCSPYDLLVVIPWHLKNVLSGVPVVYEPYIEKARYAAEYRNYWWQHIRDTKANTAINPPTGSPGPYPPSKTNINDKPVSDTGSNFGRIARIGLMNDYVDELLGKRVSGVEARHWVTFFSTYAEARDSAEVTRRLSLLLQAETGATSEEAAERAIELMRELGRLVE